MAFGVVFGKISLPHYEANLPRYPEKERDIINAGARLLPSKNALQSETLVHCSKVSPLLDKD
jgi:hypothetical protein